MYGLVSVILIGDSVQPVCEEPAMMNVMAMEKGNKERWGMIADDIWDMMLGKAGRLPGKLAPKSSKRQNVKDKFFEGNPQDNYPRCSRQVSQTDEKKTNGKWEGRRRTLRICHASRLNMRLTRVEKRKKTSWKTWQNVVPKR